MKSSKYGTEAAESLVDMYSRHDKDVNIVKGYDESAEYYDEAFTTIGYKDPKIAANLIIS